MQRLDNSYFGTEKIGTILLSIAPPVMLAQLIQALYNLVDSYFVGMHSADALTALSVVFPIQLILIAFAVGTGVGVNTYMARKHAQGDDTSARRAAGTGIMIALLSWCALSLILLPLMRPYASVSASSRGAVDDAVTYGSIATLGSIGLFLEGVFTKIHQSRGGMLRPMLAQLTGAIVNIALDPILIFGTPITPALGVAGAALATVIGQCTSAIITLFGIRALPPTRRTLRHLVSRIYYYGYSSIVMQALYTVYIIVLNIILAGFSDAAVTVLGLYYKMQTFFFIPLFGLQTCIVPLLSYNFTRRRYDRCRRTMTLSLTVTAAFMLVGIVLFVFFPIPVASLFSRSEEVYAIARIAFPTIGASFLSATFSLITPVFFQAIGMGKTSVLLSLTRQIFTLMPSFYLFSLIGLDFTWIAFPLAETVAGIVGMSLYFYRLRCWRREEAAQASPNR